MRLTIVQYAGDYREAFQRLAGGGKATYQAQRYSVGFVGGLAARHEQVAVVCALTDAPYDTVLANGVRAIGAGLKPGFAPAGLIAAVAATRPDRLCITTPIRPLIGWALAARVRTILMLADSFPAGGWRARLSGWRLARQLRRPGIEWVGNHGLNACLSLLRIGVAPARIVPWDWPASFSPHDRTPRLLGSPPLKLTYVGSLSETKGVGDLIRAVALLRERRRTVRATIYGIDHGGAMQRLVDEHALGDRVCLPGAIANEDVPDAMRAGDAVVVPSRHDYPEGLPLTIYEALASRTPILASDHPMFRGAIVGGESAMIFRAADPGSLADAAMALADDPALYARLSANGAAVWDALQLPVAWGALLSHWLEEGEPGRRWLAEHAIASGRYDARLAARRKALAG